MANAFGVARDVELKQRLDLLLTAAPFSLSRREAKRLLAAHRVVVNGRVVSIASRPLNPRDHVALLNENVSVPLLDLDSELIVVDKPAAVPTQPSPDSDNVSLLEALAGQLKQQGKPSEVELIHRLDTNTTGVILFARSKAAADKWSRRIATREAEKTYLAIVEGTVEKSLNIDAAIGRVRGNLFGVTSDGRTARSVVEPLSTRDGFSAVRVKIETGRTHQIRVHLLHVGFPVVGDRKYGGESAEASARPMLHARSLKIGELEWEAPVPADMRGVAERLGLTLD